MVNSVLSGIDVVIANGKKSELSRLRRKIELSGGTVRLNFSKAVRGNFLSNLAYCEIPNLFEKKKIQTTP